MAEELSNSAVSVLSQKEAGNKAFKEGNYVLACDLYSKAIELQQRKVGKAQDAADNEQLSILLTNRAAAHLKMLNYSLCVTDCDTAIKGAPGQQKAYYRRVQANVASGELEKAHSDLNILIRLDPKNEDFISLIRTVKAGALRIVLKES